MKWRENAAVKALAFMMAVVGFTAAAIMGWYQLMNYDVLWGEYAGYDAGPGEGYTVQYLEQLDCARLQQLLEYYNARDLGEELSAYLSQTQAALEERFDPSATNLRWQARSGAGAVRYGNAAGAVPARAQGLYWGSFSYREADGSTQWLELVLWLDGDMAVDDCYLRAYESLNQWKAARGARLAETLLCAGAGLVLTVYLCWGCGHRRGREGISLNWFHRIPGDLLLVLMGKTLTWPLFLYLFCTDFMPEWTAAHHSQHIITIIVLALIPTLYWGLRLFLWWRDRQFAVSQFKGDIRMKIFEMEHQMPEPDDDRYD